MRYKRRLATKGTNGVQLATASSKVSCVCRDDAPVLAQRYKEICSPDNTTFSAKEQAHQSFYLNSPYISDPLGQDVVWLCVGFSPTNFFIGCFVTGQVYFPLVARFVA